MDPVNSRPPKTLRHRPDAEAPLSIRYPEELPITEKREDIVRAIRENQVLVITGETGSGKSTQIPKMCLDAGRGVRGLIGCTQPRRIAAITLAARVAEEMGDAGQSLVAHKIRFQDRTARSTRIKFMTDGILLAEAQRDRLFQAYDTIIVDEAHERSLNIDFLLGLIKKILPRRPDLKVIVTSATIDPEKFSRAFGNAPIVEVSGRMYPVEVRYRPPEPVSDEGDESTYVDWAVEAVDSLKARRGTEQGGDILVFMPTESDIRETVQRLEEKRYFHTVVYPLFGRMAAGDQQRIFKPVAEEKIVVATNVAETSITIPGIRYAIDTGLARIAQYNARSRTQGLPVAPVSRASADQRKGRCGRVAAGVCIRLYSEEDYLSRPQYTAPEIQRSNLAEVILRMLYLRFGNIQEFPFLDPPSPAAIKDGFAVLRELGAVDEHRKITAIGRTMARLPLDPRLARMLIEARREGALQELMVLTSALSIQDPRERPLEKEAQADQAHAVFRDRRSDFVTLLRIWSALRLPGYECCTPDPEPSTLCASGNGDAGDGVSDSASVGEELCAVAGNVEGAVAEGGGAPTEIRLGRLGGAQFRRICRERFLSYRRMREWRDVYEEIRSILDELGEFVPNTRPAGYDAIHRSVLSGYLSHIAMRREKNVYLATRNRQVMLFPGSGLFNRGGTWIAAAELVQTSRLFARTAANIEPQWLEEVGGHMCRSTYFEPHWEKSRGQVAAFERVTLYGLPVVERRKVDYGRVHPQEAREIFIRIGLVEGEMPKPYGFMEHNRALIRRIEELESKARRRDLLVDDEALYAFYDRKLPQIADIRSFDRLLKESGGDEFLRMTEADLLRATPDFEALDQFPDSIPAEGADLPLRYAFRPGEEDDGVTVTVPVHILPRLSAIPFEWLVPGLLLEKVTVLLKALPKGLRKQLVPVGETARRLRDRLPFRDGSLFVQLSRSLREMSALSVPPEQWDCSGLPEHLRMRFEITGPDERVLGAGRDLERLGEFAVERHEDRLWADARARWEKEVKGDFGELPPEVQIGKDALGLVRYAYPGLSAEATGVFVRLFTDPEAARKESLKGLEELYRLVFAAEWKQYARIWVFPEEKAGGIFFMGPRHEANRRLQEYVLRELFDLHSVQLPDREKFLETVGRLKGRLGELGSAIVGEVLAAVAERETARAALQRFRKMGQGNPGLVRRLDLLMKDLERLAPADFPSRARRSFVQQLPRYFKALRIRAERVYNSPEKDRLKAEQLVPHVERCEELEREALAEGGGEALLFSVAFREMLEEFKISLFAPEVKARIRVSSKRLEEKWDEWKLQRGRVA